MNWIKTADRLPEEEGSYLILVDFHEPCISIDKIVRKRVAFASNFTFEKGWMSQVPEFSVTHWMPIILPQDEL
jgi:hypothetical protein